MTGTDARRIAVAVTAAGFAVFALLYATQPLLPHLAGEFGLDPGTASLAVSASTIAVAVGVLPLAALADVLGRRRVMAGSIALTVLLAVACAFAPSYPALLVLRVLLGLAVAGLPATAMAYLAERLTGVARGVALGALVAGNSLGGMSGRLLAGVSYEWLGWRGALGATAGLSVLAAVVFAVALPSRDAPAATARNPDSGVLAGLRAALCRPLLLAQYGVAALAMGAFVAMYNAAGFRLTSAPLSLAPGLASLVFVAYAMGAFSSPLAGRLAERHGRMRVLLGALGVTLAGAVCTLPDSVPAIACGFAVFTGGFFAAHAAASGWVGAAASAGARGQASGLYQCAYYAGASVGGTAGSAVYGHAGWPVLIVVLGGWLLLAGLGVLAGVLLDGRAAGRRAVRAAASG